MLPFSLDASVDCLKGVGKERKAALERAGIRTVQDLVFFFPRSYRSGDIFPVTADRCDRYGYFSLTVDTVPAVVNMGKGRRVFRYLASDENGNRVHVLYYHQPYLKGKIMKGDHAFYFGKLREKSGVFYLFSPERELTAPTPGSLRPVYSAPGGISSRQMEKLISQCLIPSLSQIGETLPQRILSRFSLIPRNRAVYFLHAPSGPEDLKAAKRRFSFEQLFFFRVKAMLFTMETKKQKVAPFQKTDLTPFFQSLPFTLTEAQQKVISEIKEDLTGTEARAPMNRLLQGDVGSGKTVVAAAAAYLAAQNGKSTLVMAPTEILAQQHYLSFCKYFENTAIPIFLLTGSTTKKERSTIFSYTTQDVPYILIGTHALTEESALCENVSLAITDEQHRFGVRQRNRLGEKGGAVHSLVMSATPIPRSLAMFLASDSNISVIDRVPSGRQKIDTLYVGEDKMSRIYAFLEEKIKLGQQAYIVCPLIEDEDGESELISAKDEVEEIRKALANCSISLLHGKMKSEEKKSVMASFQKNETQILVSTTVIEVGVDVPNATVMVILNAERFGLSQLHQLRGRVGRGTEKSFCILVSSHSSKSARERLKKLCDCHDGFELAKYDLKTRGPGEFFGTRQSGFGAGDLFSECTMEEIEEVQEAARIFLENASAEELSAFSQETKLN